MVIALFFDTRFAFVDCDETFQSKFCRASATLLEYSRARLTEVNSGRAKCWKITLGSTSARIERMAIDHLSTSSGDFRGLEMLDRIVRTGPPFDEPSH